MDDLTREGSDFKFHFRCSRLRLTHLCFADDLLIFSEANLSSISIIKMALLEFEHLSGLKANPSKSYFYCSGVSARLKVLLLDDLQMKEGQLPVRYLGVPLISSNLSAADCSMLMEKISGRLDSWTSKKLSFAGRLQLISSVLYGLQVYWMGIFILPKKILKDIIQKFNRFLWNGKEGSSAKAKMAWKELCFPKKEGGLGLKDLDAWNKSSMLRHVWSLFACSGSIWVAWIQNYMLKGRSFWSVNIPQTCSWSWRKLLKLRSIAKNFLKHEVGDGKHIHLWIDNWHPSGALVEKYGYRIVYDAQSRLDARLETVLRNGNWCWKPARSDHLVEIQSRLPEVRLGVFDKPIWTISRSGSYTCADTWDFLRQKKIVVEWWSIVWFKFAIPKQAFLLWLTVRNRLTTGDRLLTWGFMGDTQCVFCRHCTESRDHLFFMCSFSARIWKECMTRCNILNPCFDWQDVIAEGCRSWRTKSMFGVVCRLVLSSSVYGIWRARNEIKHSGHPCTEEQILKMIIWEVRSRIASMGKFQRNEENISLCFRWNVDVSILF